MRHISIALKRIFRQTPSFDHYALRTKTPELYKKLKPFERESLRKHEQLQKELAKSHPNQFWEYDGRYYHMSMKFFKRLNHALKD